MQNVLTSAVPHRSEWRRRRTTGGGRRQRQERGRCGCCSDRQRRPRNYRLIFNRVAVREFCDTRTLVCNPILKRLLFKRTGKVQCYVILHFSLIFETLCLLFVQQSSCLYIISIFLPLVLHQIFCSHLPLCFLVPLLLSILEL